MKNSNPIIIMLLTMVSACAPDYLDVKPDKALVVPTELNHLQALIDNYSGLMNVGPGIQALATDEFSHPEQNLANLPFAERNTYLWAEDVFEGRGIRDWENPFKAIFYSNIALDGIKKIHRTSANQKEYDRVYGSALFYRSFSVFQLADIFAAPYESSTSEQLPGIPFRQSMDINELVSRGTLKQTYDRIIEDLIEAEKWLDPSIGYLNRPSKPAVSAALARVYLSMGQYEKAGAAADAALGYHDVLLDYNTLNANAARPFTGVYLGNNPEVIFNYAMQPYELVAVSTLTGVDTTMYNLYEESDLRKTCFFQLRPAGNYTFKGSYSGAAQLFGGLSTDELYLIRAESYARAGQTQLALADLNKLLEKRFKAGTFKPVSSSDDKIVDLVLKERRKQLFGRGARWTDLRRLNKEPARAITLIRHLKEQTLTLPPNHNRYVFPIPDDEISLSGIQQNPR